MDEKNNKDTDQETINIVKNDLGEEIIIHDIERYNLRYRIFKTKKKLKGKTVSITESLTKKRVVELEKAREMCDFQNVWSHDAKTSFLDVNDRNKVKVFYAQRCCLMKGKDEFFLFSLLYFYLNFGDFALPYC